MPTPTGLLKKGDLTRYKADGSLFKVLERSGNDLTYSVILQVVRWNDRTHPLPRPAFGYPAGTFRLLEAAYWITHTYEIVA